MDILAQLTFWHSMHFRNRHFGSTVDILGVDISALPHLPYVDKYVICRQDRLSVSTREEESPSVFFLFRFPRAHETDREREREQRKSFLSFFLFPLPRAHETERETVLLRSVLCPL